MDDLKDVPHIPPTLLKWLRDGNPTRHWTPGTTIEAVMFEAGRQDIIKDLEEILRQQEEEEETED